MLLASGGSAMRAPAAAQQQQQHLHASNATLARSRRRHCGSPTAARAQGSSGSSSSTDQGFSLLTWTNKVLPQGQIVQIAKETTRFAWATMVKELAPQSKDGAYTRPKYAFEGRINTPQFPDEAGRYHLYLGNACPWCHRVLLALVLKGMLRPAPAAAAAGAGGAVCGGAGARGTLVSFTQLGSDPTKARRGGWIFEAGKLDPVWGAQDLWEVYDTASPGFRGRCTAPLLVDAAAKAIVSNESADIVRMVNESRMPGTTGIDLYPQHLRADIDALNDQIYEAVNNGVYASGFSTSQQAYDGVQERLYSTLDELEARLGRSRFLLGDKLCEADVRLLPTIARFDAVYAGIMKCSRRRIADCPNLQGWMRDMMQVQVEGSAMQVCDTLDVDAARVSYYSSLFPLNPSGIVPAGPTQADLGLGLPHGRGASSRAEDVCFMLEG